MPDKKVLHLTITREWFDKIASGEKKEEYRLIKNFYIKRLFEHPDIFSVLQTDCLECKFRKDSDDKMWIHCTKQDLEIPKDVGEGCVDFRWNDNYFRKYDQLHLRNGRRKDSPTLLMELKKISIGIGKPEWGGETDRLCFILHLGEVLEVGT